MVEDDDIASLIASPAGTLWKDPAMEDRLKSRLPKSYDLFLDTINDINASMDELKNELGVNRVGFQQGLQEEEPK